MRSIKRSIYFYHVNIFKYNKDTNTAELTNNFKKDINYIIEELKILAFDKENLECSVYERKNNGTYDFVNIEKMRMVTFLDN